MYDIDIIICSHFSGHRNVCFHVKWWLIPFDDFIIKLFAWTLLKSAEIYKLFKVDIIDVLPRVFITIWIIVHDVLTSCGFFLVDCKYVYIVYRLQKKTLMKEIHTLFLLKFMIHLLDFHELIQCLTWISSK